MKLTREFPSNYTMAQGQTADHADAQVVGMVRNELHLSAPNPRRVLRRDDLLVIHFPEGAAAGGTSLAGVRR